VASLELAVAISPASVLNAASISKQFTAMSILLLARRGHLSLDDDVGRYIPNWGERGHRITIRHLLSHTSGLREAFTLQGLRPELPRRRRQRPSPCRYRIFKAKSACIATCPTTRSAGYSFATAN
jgi:CubicO group peptidase (beta-lactamase class C family)